MVVGWEFLTDNASLESVLSAFEPDGQTLTSWASALIEERGLDRRTVIKRSRLNQTFAYQILAGTRRASRDKLIQLAFGLQLDVEECSELLERGGCNALSPRIRRDVVIAYCLSRKFGMDVCDDLLWASGERTIISVPEIGSRHLAGS